MHVLAAVFGRENMGLVGIGLEDQLGQHRLAAVVFRIGLGALQARAAHGAHVVDLVAPLAVDGEQPQPLRRGLARQRGASGQALVFAAPAQQGPSAQRLAVLEQVGRQQGAHIDHPGNPACRQADRRHTLVHLDGRQGQWVDMVAAKAVAVHETVGLGLGNAVDQHLHPVATQAADFKPGIALAPGGARDAGTALGLAWHLHVHHVPGRIADVQHLLALQIGLVQGLYPIGGGQLRGLLGHHRRRQLRLGRLRRCTHPGPHGRARHLAQASPQLCHSSFSLPSFGDVQTLANLGRTKRPGGGWLCAHYMRIILIN